MKLKGLVGLFCVSPLFVTPLVSCSNKPEIKVILMAGQSNMEGHDASWNKDYVNPTTHETFYKLEDHTVRDYEMGHDNVKIDYDCTYNKWRADPPTEPNSSHGEFVDVKFGYGRNQDLFGPEVGFAKYLGEHDPNQTYYIIKSAEGSSGLYNDWSKAGHSYQTFVEDVKIGIDNIKKLNKSFKICGFVWMQGEEDAQHDHGIDYKDNMIDLLDRIGDNFSQYYISGGLTVVDGGISTKGSSKDYATVNKAKQELADTRSRYEYVSLSERLSMVNDWHYTNTGYLALGEAFASAYLNAN